MAMMASFSGSAAVTASMNVPQTQNTAPVLEFRCLFTQDLRRKQKRWSDGRLEFHTFNKRVMVYDDRSNFVGDTHWREDSDFAEGEELELERSGTLVEVGECVGKRDQDLTELVDKRVKEREERAAAKAATPIPSSRNQVGTSTPNIPQHKPLNALVTPTGHYGRALVPGTSPFEDKQGPVVRQKDEQERPAKRRKPNELTSNKSGYAQNLTGATLSLASSRPPSTGPIRYEPVRVIPAIPVRSEMIDLTLGESENSDQGNAVRRDTGKTPKAQKKTRRSPPPKSGYASNLTGVALTLSRPDSFRPNRPSNFSTLQPVATSKVNHETSSEEEEEIIPPKRPPEKEVTKAKERRKPRKSKSPQLQDSLSPSRKQKATEKRASRPPTAVQESSGIEPTPARPMSALRIKGRSAPKMMMLMNRPSSRMMASGESSDSRRRIQAPLQRSSETSSDIVLSQATMDLNAFCQKQEERLQARLRGERRATIMEIDDVSSSPEDTDIDHQTIDLLLSRRNKPAEKVVDTTSKPSPSIGVVAGIVTGKEKSQLTHEERKEEKNLPTSSSDISSPQLNPELPTEPLPDAPGSRSRVPSNSVAEASREIRPQPSPAPMIEGRMLPPRYEREHEPVPDIAQPIQTEITIESLGGKAQKPKQLPHHVINDYQAAREHFRNKVKSSVSQQHEIADIPRLPEPDPEPEQILESIHPAPIVAPVVQEANSRGVPLKNSPGSRQLIGDDVVEEHESSENANPVIAAATKIYNVPELPVVQNMPARRVVANPATRGKSIQILAANTVDTLNNPPSIMAPPPRLSSRTETINGLNDVARGLDGGPWSREAFDLFDKKTCERIMTLRAASTATG